MNESGQQFYSLSPHSPSHMKKCFKCGRQNEDSAGTCLYCATPFSSEQPSEAEPSEAEQTLEPEDTFEAERSYTFTEGETRMIGSVGSYMRIVGILLVTGGIIQLAAAALGLVAGHGGTGIAAGIGGILALVMGNLTVEAGTSFGKSSATTGNEIGHLMKAVAALRSLYRLQVVLVVISIAALILVALQTNLHSAPPTRLQHLRHTP